MIDWPCNSTVGWTITQVYITSTPTNCTRRWDTTAATFTVTYRREKSPPPPPPDYVYLPEFWNRPVPCLRRRLSASRAFRRPYTLKQPERAKTARKRLHRQGIIRRYLEAA